ncbi:hypothetical protein MKQ68_09760 [Chitinophaga horti]|uniref:Lipoprotein n=1 Tax=Chitinophaga horti TaxID=2920382 RepID=A0ABY6J711_9BACT|nr:hypothetical protein [Chitinophaga horti]UYQ95382.1 hypothetical protein MKQ68_09760 [Chitinophaga horti]
MRYVSLLSFLLVFAACSPKYYRTGDYSFYDQKFSLPDTALLRKDGVYVSDSMAYVFYKGGQSNLVLTPGNHLQAIAERHRQQRPTLFEGYYRVQGRQLVIQSVNNARRQFYYTYALLSPDSLTVVRQTIKGKRRFKEKYFTSSYKAHYLFMPLDTAVLNRYKPYW